MNLERWTKDVPRDIQDWTIGNWIDEARILRLRINKISDFIYAAEARGLDYVSTIDLLMALEADDRWTE